MFFLENKIYFIIKNLLLKEIYLHLTPEKYC